MSKNFHELRRDLVATLRKIDVTDTYLGRQSLLNGLPKLAVNRSEGNAQLDLNSIIEALYRLGRLNDQGGTRPLILVIENALEYVAPTGAVAEELYLLKQELEALYGGDEQPGILDQAAVSPEALIFQQRDNRLPFSFIAGAYKVGASVARLLVPKIVGNIHKGSMYGTAWLIAPGLLMTNYHVIEARQKHAHYSKVLDIAATVAEVGIQVEQAIAWFDYRSEGDKEYIPCRCTQVLAYNEALDYAIIQLDISNQCAQRPPLQIVLEPIQLSLGDRLNIPQHSGGGPLQFAIRNNFFVQHGTTAAVIQYQTDTEPGASGSPVCDDKWRVIALHHASTHIEQPQQVPQEVIIGKAVSVHLLNQAIAIHTILADLPPVLRQQIIDAQK